MQGTQEHEWARKIPDGQEAWPWKVTAAAAGGFQGRVADREWGKNWPKILGLRKVRVVTVEKTNGGWRSQDSSAVRKVDTLH